MLNKAGALNACHRDVHRMLKKRTLGRGCVCQLDATASERLLPGTVSSKRARKIPQPHPGGAQRPTSTMAPGMWPLGEVSGGAGRGDVAPPGPRSPMACSLAGFSFDPALSAISWRLARGLARGFSFDPADASTLAWANSFRTDSHSSVFPPKKVSLERVPLTSFDPLPLGVGVPSDDPLENTDWTR